MQVHMLSLRAFSKFASVGRGFFYGNTCVFVGGGAAVARPAGVKEGSKTSSLELGLKQLLPNPIVLRAALGRGGGREGTHRWDRLSKLT